MKQEVDFLERESRRELGLKKKSKVSELNERCRVKREKLKTVIEELKQKMLAKSAQVRRYEKVLNNSGKAETLILISRRSKQNSM